MAALFAAEFTMIKIPGALETADVVRISGGRLGVIPAIDAYTGVS